MPYSTNTPRRPKIQYNKTRMAILVCQNLGLVLFLFALGLTDYEVPLFIGSMVLVWTGAVLAYRNYQAAEGKGVEIAARFSWFISIVEAVLLTVLSISRLV